MHVLDCPNSSPHLLYKKATSWLPAELHAQAYCGIYTWRSALSEQTENYHYRACIKLRANDMGLPVKRGVCLQSSNSLSLSSPYPSYPDWGRGRSGSLVACQATSYRHGNSLLAVGTRQTQPFPISTRGRLDASVGPKLPLCHVIPVASQSFAYLEVYSPKSHIEESSFSCLSAGVVLPGPVGRGAVSAVPPVSVHTPDSS